MAMNRVSEMFNFRLVGSISMAPWTTSGKIDGHRMDAFIDHRLGEIERGEFEVLEPAVVEQDLMHADLVAEGRGEQIVQADPDIIGR